MKQTPEFNHFTALSFTAALLAIALLVPARTLANTAETLMTSDANATSSISGNTNWTPATLVAMTNASASTYDYSDTGSYSMRTPPDGNNYTVYANSLTIGNGTVNNNCALGFKGYGLVTIPNLILNGGAIKNSSVITAAGYTTGNTNFGLLVGSINLASSSSIYGTGAGSGMNIYSTITNSPGVSATLSLTAGGTIILSAQNTFNGNIAVLNSTPGTTLQLGINNALPSTAQLGLNGGSSAGNSTLDLNGYSTTVSNLVFSTGTYLGIVTNSAFGTTGTLSIGYNNPSSQVITLNSGTIMDNPSIGGTIALTKVGLGSLLLGVAYPFSGNLTISGGTNKMGASNILPWGVGKGNLIINSGGTLDMSGRGETVNGLFGSGTIDNSGGTAGLSYILTTGSNDVSSTFSGVIQNTLGSAYVGLTKVGAGTLTLQGNNTFNGPVKISGGQLWITNSTAFGSGPKTNTIQNGTDAELHLNGTNGNISFSSALSFLTANDTGSGAIVNEAGNNIINGTIALTTGGGTVISVNAGSLTLAGNIAIATTVASRTLTLGGTNGGMVSGVIADGDSGALSLTKSGTGTWTLTTPNTYSDITTINTGGTLALSGSGSIASSTNIALQAGSVLDVSAVTGGWTNSAGQILKGSGHVAGNATINGTLSPGSASIGTITFSNNLTLAGTTVLKINNTNSPNADMIAVLGTLARGGTLIVTNTGDTLVAGNSFTNFSMAGSGGSFSTTNLPALTDGLVWDTSLLNSQGIIMVVSSGPGIFTNKTGIISFSLNGANIVLTGTNGQAGDAYYLLQSTNVALPLSQWMVAATNVLNAGGNFTFTGTNVVIPGSQQQFFILSNTNSNH